MTLKIGYFAILREQRGLSEEVLETSALTPAELYRELHARHAFSLEGRYIRAAVNDEFVPMSQPLTAGDHVVFIPPVAGG